MTEMTTTQELDFPQTAQKQSPFGIGSIVLIIGILATGAVFGWALTQQNATQPTQGAAKEFTLTTFDDDVIHLSDFRGDVVVVNFWASWCGPCRAEAPALQSTWERYQDRGVAFIGIAYADNGPRSLEFIEEFGITYLNGPDLGVRISDEYNIMGVPETFIIDQEGNVAKFIYAGVTEQELSLEIDALLERG